MNLFDDKNEWVTKLEPIIQKYKDRKHPLEYKNTYQLMVMVVLSAQDSDANVNKISLGLFKIYPNFESLATANFIDLIPHISKVKNYETKGKWLIEMAQTIKTNKNIPINMNGLVALKGIGRKSANVILRETKVAPEGIISDLHVIRVAPRIGLCLDYKDGNRIEKELMLVFPKSIWGEIGMILSLLGREICRPTNPNCSECLINPVCLYFNNL